jgi:hypothetical protein
MGLGDPLDTQNDLFSSTRKGSEAFSKSLKTDSESMYNAYSLNLNKLQAKYSDVFGQILKGIDPLDSDAFAELDKYANEIQRSFGTSRERMDEFKSSIADVGPELMKLGVDETQITNNMISVMGGLKTTATIGKEAIVELTAAFEVTQVPIETLASSFRDVGISIYDVGEQMKTVTEVARGAGVSVSAVAGLVTQNLGKMNIYNFDNGVKGIAKMAATSERLGITMNQVFEQAEKLMDPEKAIDMSSALQRLGVTSSGLLDPLRAMDLAQNDPEALQKEIVSLGKEFTRFNERTGQMEILPGAKRRMREVADAVGMTAEEFASMALKAGDFDMKLKQIKMPSFAEGDEETKELIASMSQLKDGIATIQIKDDKTGAITSKTVEELTPEDIERLRKANEESSKTIEQLAVDQLDVTKRIESLLSSGAVATKFAKATSPTLSKFYGLVAEGNLALAEGVTNMVGSTQDIRNMGESLGKPLEKMVVGKATGDEASVAMGQKELGENLFKLIGDFENKAIAEITGIQTNMTEKIKSVYSQPLKVEAKSDSNLNLNLNLKSDVAGLNFSPADIEKIKIAMLNDPDFASKLKKVLENNLVSASTGGKNQ